MFHLTSVVFQHTATYLQEADSAFSIFSQKGAEDSSIASLNLPTIEQTQLYCHVPAPDHDGSPLLDSMPQKQSTCIPRHLSVSFSYALTY